MDGHYFPELKGNKLVRIVLSRLAGRYTETFVNMTTVVPVTLKRKITCFGPRR